MRRSSPADGKRSFSVLVFVDSEVFLGVVDDDFDESLDVLIAVLELNVLQNHRLFSIVRS